ncbi:MAG: FAD-dependent oxidoreductase [Proteobacteria bacterium]|nr:FAD-dependent oxidoreductase [Pseudomonadota bacterium]
MSPINISIDGQPVEAQENDTILQAARRAGIYIPTICNHPDLPPGKSKKPAAAVWQGGVKIENAKDEQLGGCGLCVVELTGQAEPQPACVTPVAEGMEITTSSEALNKLRKQKLIPILARHPHACLACAQAAGCSRTQCSSNVAEAERCCEQFGNCELQKVVNYLGIHQDTPRWIPSDRPKLLDDPLYKRDYNLCIGCTRCVRACEDLRGVGALGFVFDADGLVQVGTLAQGLAESGCRFCTACVEVCPTGAILDHKLPSGDKAKALVPCRSACPAEIDVPDYLRLIAAGQPDQALAVIRQRVPLPGVLGRVCIHPCEDNCRRGSLNDPIGICLLKRYAADQGGAAWKQRLERLPATGKKVAVVGAGPAGLSAAFYLACKGHAVTILEAEEHPGGMLRYGIPAYRLPVEVLEAEIGDIAALGVDIKTNAKVDSLEELTTQGDDALFLSMGAQLSRRLEIEGAELPSVLWGLDFLKAIRRGENPRVGPKVVVVGGGNVAIDVALSAVRQGAQEVDLVCLEKREEMPAHSWEVAQAEDEGVRVRNSWGPIRVAPDGAITFRRCTAVFDQQGRFNPSYDDAEAMELPTDQVILAIGQATDLGLLGAGGGVGVARGLIAADPDTLATGMAGVFAGGDAVVMPGAVILAIAAGRRAARSMDEYLGGDGDIDFSLGRHEPPSPCLGRVEGFAWQPRVAPAELAPEQRSQGYDEICLGFSPEQAMAEAGRCLQCQLRLMIGQVPGPPEHLLPFSAEAVDEVPESEGVFILFDQEKNILVIQGTMNLREDLAERLEGGSSAAYFEYEPDPMYSKAESERIQAYLQRHGSMPPGDGSGGGDDLDDLF